jgi:hypothetical protein
MAGQTNTNPVATGLPPEAIEFAGKIYNAARAGQIEVFEQALPAGLPANMRNEKGDTLVSLFCLSLPNITTVYRYLLFLPSENFHFRFISPSFPSL